MSNPTLCERISLYLDLDCYSAIPDNGILTKFLGLGNTIENQDRPDK